MKKIIIQMLIPIMLKAQISANLDLAFDYYRAAGVATGAALILREITKDPFWSGVGGIVIGCAQGWALERGLAGKTVSCMGSAGGVVFIYIPICINQREQREKRELEKAKLLIE